MSVVVKYHLPYNEVDTYKINHKQYVKMAFSFVVKSQRTF